MSDVISKLSVELALESGSFAKQMSAINKEIKNLDRDFKSASKGVEGFEKSFVGLDAKIQKNGQQIELYTTKLEKQKQAYSKLEDTIQKQVSKLNELEQANKKGSDEWNKTSELVQKNSEKLNKLSTDINSTESSISKLTNELNQAQSEFQQLGQKTETLDSKLDKIVQSANLAESEFNRLGSELAQSGTYFQKLDNEINRLNSQLDSSKAKVSAYESEISRIGTVLDKAKVEHSQLAQEINKTENELNQAKSAYGANSSEALQLSQKLLRLKDSYNQVESEINKGTSELNQYQTELNNTVADVNRLSNELKTMPFNRVGNDMKTMGQNIKGVGQDLMPVTLAIGGVGVASAKASLDFESAFTGVVKTVDMTTSEMKEMEDGIRNLSKQMPTAATEIAGVAEAAGQLGIKKESILSFTKTMVMLGDTTNLSADEAASSLARLANITGMPQSEFDRLGSTVVALGNNMATTEADIVSMGLRLAGAGSQVGMTEAQIMSFSAALSSVGIEAEAGGSAFSKVMIEMQLAAEKGGDKLNNFAKVAGMSASDFKKAFETDAAGAILSFIQGLGSAEERGLSAIGILDDMGISEVRLRDSLLRAAGASGVFSEALQIGTGAWEDNNALTKEAETRYNTNASKLEIMKNKMIDAAVTIGNNLMPAILSCAEWVANLSEKFAGLDSGTQTAILAIAGLAAIIPPLLILFGSTISAVGTIATAFSGTGATAGLLSGAMGALSSIALPAVIAALGLLAVAVGDSSDTLLMLQDKFGSLGVIVGGVCEFISGVWTATFSQLANVAQLGMDLIAACIDGVGGQTVKQAWDDYNNRTIALQEEAADKLTLTTTRGLSQMRNATDEQLHGCITTMDSILSQVPAIVDGNYKQAASTVATQLATMDSTQISTLQAMNDTTRMMFQGIKEGMNVDEATAQVMTNLKLMQANGKLNTETLNKDVTAAMETMKKNMDSNTKDGAKAVDTNTKDAKDKASKNAKDLAKEVDKATKDAKTKGDLNTKDLSKNVNANTKDASNKAKANMDKGALDVGNATNKMANEAKKGTELVAKNTDVDFKRANRSIQQEATNMYNGAKQSFTKLAEIARKAGSDMYNGVSRSAQKMAQSAKQAASDMYRGVTTSTSSMANRAIADWNRVRSAYSNPIRASISVVRTQTNRTINEKAVTRNKTLGEYAQSANVLKSINTPPMTLGAASNGLNSNGIATLGESSPISAFKSSSTGFTLNEDTQKNLEQQLKITKAVEEKITEILRKEVEKRKKLIDSELKNRIDSLNKEKKAYNDARKEADYNKSYEEQLNSINELQDKIDILSRDSSLSGQKKLKELMDKLADEQEKLSKMVQDKIDEQVNNMFDKESDRLTDDANKAKEEMDNLLDSKKLQSFINQTLDSGVFEHINGEVSNLKDVMLGFIDEYGDGLSSVGALIKSELIENLNIARDTMKDMSSILDKLGIGQYRTSSRSIDLSKLDFNSSRYRNNLTTSDAINGKIRSNSSNSSKPVIVNFNQPLVKVEGSVDQSLMPKIEEMIKQAQEQLVEDIISKIR
ncbi:phage tail tape measure protein [Paraclostridium sordellii]|uniref:phage tail tape measure protein n=1 Tax=Paraclostridium sordellii TaxID=1505 RepID=UPI0005E32EF3|nr:phage tail tape measure protein [Paeniclostridium sordellii]CEN94271.1 phage tail tape measure protein [[Clostridium] sordellii] [Paeniclostridium sordellii]CEN94705.1 phage tail tape measure protein [[Clostridium] sordellii] [Paeniclostridium sordellii]